MKLRRRLVFSRLMLAVLATIPCNVATAGDSATQKDAEQFAQYGFTRILLLNLQVEFLKREARQEVVEESVGVELAGLLDHDDAWLRSGLYKVNEIELKKACEHFGLVEPKRKVENLDITLKLMIAAQKLCIIRTLAKNPDVPLNRIVDFVKYHVKNKSIKTVDGWVELRKR